MNLDTGMHSPIEHSTDALHNALQPYGGDSSFVCRREGFERGAVSGHLTDTTASIIPSVNRRPFDLESKMSPIHRATTGAVIESTGATTRSGISGTGDVPSTVKRLRRDRAKERRAIADEKTELELEQFLFGDLHADERLRDVAALGSGADDNGTAVVESVVDVDLSELHDNQVGVCGREGAYRSSMMDPHSPRPPALCCRQCTGCCGCAHGKQVEERTCCCLARCRR